MDKRLKYSLIVGGFTVLLVGVVTTIFFLLFGPEKDIPANTLYVFDIEVAVGESKPVKFEVSSDKAIIRLELLDNSNIITISNMQIRGEKEGIVSVDVIAVFDNEKIKKTFKVKVVKPASQQDTFGYNVDCIKNCNFYDGAILAQHGEVVFGLDIFKNEKPFNSKLEIIVLATEGIKVQREFSLFILTPSSSGVVSFYIPAINYSFSLKLKKV